MHCTNGLEMAAYAINCRVAIISINCHLLIYETQLLTVIRHNHVYLQLIWMLYVCVYWHGAPERTVSRLAMHRATAMNF